MNNRLKIFGGCTALLIICAAAAILYKKFFA